MELKRTKGGYRITVDFASKEGTSNYAVFFWDGSKLKVKEITDLDYLESLSEEVSQYLNKIKKLGVL